MHFLLLLWLSQQPSLITSEKGALQVALNAMLLTHDRTQSLLPYERSLLKRVAQSQMTVAHMLAYLREHEQA
ncbi:hypothetical protein E5K02_08150 [Hymenobacter metallicola]|uniref:Uncharacterized protein n=1 Tax=Hymenobacter metallicola TaxID=2563114 RepID=A0A4Z0QK66_9BACT|nr:hypothetical protein E5K02_08150 [Hymenobacter metallicola]